MRTRRTRAVTAALCAAVVPLAFASCSHGSDKASSTAATPSAGKGITGATNGSAAPSTPPVDLAVAKRPASDRQVISTAELDLQRAISTARSIARRPSSTTRAATSSPKRRA